MYKLLVGLLCVTLLVSACETRPAATPTPELPTGTSPAPTPTSLPVAPTITLAPPTATSVPPTATPLPPLDGRGGDGDVVAFYSERDGNSEIYAMNADGSGLRRLADDPAADDSPVISPDGSRIVFLTARHDPNPKFPDFKYEIYVMDIDGTNQRRLTITGAGEDHPAWSPDGKQIIFQSDRGGNFEIYAMDRDGGNQRRLTDYRGGDYWPSWGRARPGCAASSGNTSGGGPIAFVSVRDGNGEIYVMNADGSDQPRLTNYPQWDGYSSLSPDGKQIAYYSYLDEFHNLPLDLATG